MLDISSWKLIVWLLGTLGVAGTIALFVFAPAIFTKAIDLVVRFFTLVLSYRIGCALVAAALAAFIADWHRDTVDRAEFAERIAAFEQAQDKRDEGVRKSTEQLVRRQIAEQFTLEQDAKNEVADFKDRLPPGDAFHVGADADKLRKIAGEAVSGPSKGVPQTARKGVATDHRVGNRLSRFGRRSVSRAGNRQPAPRRQGKV